MLEISVTLIESNLVPDADTILLQAQLHLHNLSVHTSLTLLIVSIPWIVCNRPLHFCRQTNLEETNKRLEEEVQRLRAKVDRHQKERNELEDRALEAEQAALVSREECKKAAGQSRREMQDDQERSSKVGAG